MSVFVDKKYENLDWISAATEPVESILNVILSDMPDLIEIDFEIYRKVVGSSWNMGISIGDILNRYLGNSKMQNRILSYDHQIMLRDCFDLELEGSPVIDWQRQEIFDGKIFLVKKIFTLEDKELNKIMGKMGIDSVRMMSSYNSSHTIQRSNEIMEILGGCETDLKSRSPRTKRQAIIKRLTKLFKNNEWNIKDTELADKVGYWISDYIEKGNLASFSNFCRLKVMTHKGNPIYSMEEVE
jgi:hypothetical protein